MVGAKAQQAVAADAFTLKAQPPFSTMPVPPMPTSLPMVGKARYNLRRHCRHGEDGTVRVVRPQVSSLVFTSGTLTIDSDKGEITHSDGSFLLGEFSDKTYTDGDGNAYPYQVVTYTADTISLGSGVVVT